MFISYNIYLSTTQRDSDTLPQRNRHTALREGNLRKGDRRFIYDPFFFLEFFAIIKKALKDYIV